jgi:hypothetical protein
MLPDDCCNLVAKGQATLAKSHRIGLLIQRWRV